MKTETREVSTFDSIELRAFGATNITQGDKESLTIEGDEDTLQKIISRVEGTKLILELGQTWFDRIMAGLQANDEVDVVVSQTLDIKIASYGDVTYKGDPRVSQTISGAGSVKRIAA